MLMLERAAVGCDRRAPARGVAVELADQLPHAGAGLGRAPCAADVGAGRHAAPAGASDVDQRDDVGGQAVHA